MSISMFITIVLLLKKLTTRPEIDVHHHLTDTEFEDVPPLIDDDNSDSVDSVSNSDVFEAPSNRESMETTSNWNAVKRLSKRISVVFSQVPLMFIPGLAEQEEPEKIEEYHPERTIFRDFAYPTSSPYHYEIDEPSEEEALELDETHTPTSSEGYSRRDSCTLEDADHQADDFYESEAEMGDIYCDAIALYDFKPETDYEISMKAGDKVWVQYRQCLGWFVADVNDDTGLIPESYVELQY